MGDRGLKSMFLFAPLQVILAITSTSETVIPTNHKICLFFFSWLLLLLFSSAYQHWLEQVSDIMQFPTVYNFPIHLHTCFLIYIDDKILCSKSVLMQCLILAAYNSNFFFAYYIMDDNPIGSL